MLDFDLARIYGYTTKAFNQQIERNKERFPKEFAFRLTSEEAHVILRSQFVTANPLSSKRRYLPYAFTEQGIYMVMTVLKGERAVKQSIMLVTLFKAMRDHIAKEDPEAFTALSKEVESHAERIGILETGLNALATQIGNGASQNELLIMDGERIEASLAFRSIFARAQNGIILIDDYIGLKTLHLLKSAKPGIHLTILSDNVARTPLTKIDLLDFEKDTHLFIHFGPTKNKIHDRYIVLDYGSSAEVVFHCGASSKDAGDKVTTIMKVENPEDYHRFIDSLLNEAK